MLGLFNFSKMMLIFLRGEKCGEIVKGKFSLGFFYRTTFIRIVYTIIN